MTAATAPYSIDRPLSARRVAERALKVPLVAKLVGANGLIVIVAWVATWLTHRAQGGEFDVLLVLGAALLAALIVNAFLVSIALRPIRLIEGTAERFWKGDIAARVPWSAVADKDLERLSKALNLLLESNEQERIRLRALAEGIMRYEEHVRVETARVLQESHAQTLAGLLYRISAAITRTEDPDAKADLEHAREIAQRGAEALRELSSRVHPRLLDDFGLIAAVRQMSRTIEKENAGVRILVDHEEVLHMREVTRSDKVVMYRGTEEAIQNALANGANEINVCIRASDDALAVDVTDNGRGFPVGTDAGSNTALWLLRERLAFIGGSCVVRSDPGGGARVSMRLPLRTDIIEASPMHPLTSHAA